MGKRHTEASHKIANMPHPPAQVMGKDGAPMVLIPAGEFTMGSDKGDDDEEPIHRLFLDSSIWINSR